MISHGASMGKDWRLTLRWLTLYLVVSTSSLQALPWDKDMADQPALKAQEQSQVPLLHNSVPVHGKDVFDIPADMAQLFQARALAWKVTNPVANNAAAQAHGRNLYQIFCAVCHGKAGLGDGPVGKKFVPQPLNLRLDYVQQQGDGQLYFTISHGSVAMPFYRDSMSVLERWQLVNYIKQGLLEEGVND